jgi:hypothetical protein
LPERDAALGFFPSTSSPRLLLNIKALEIFSTIGLLHLLTGDFVDLESTGIDHMDERRPRNVPDTIGKIYRVGRKIGSGSFGDIHMGRLYCPLII